MLLPQQNCPKYRIALGDKYIFRSACLGCEPKITAVELASALSATSNKAKCFIRLIKIGSAR